VRSSVGTPAIGEIGGTALVEVVPALLHLAAAQIPYRPLLSLAVHPVEQMTEQDLLRGDGRIRLDLADPVTVRRLEGKQTGLGARDRRVEACHGA
jgi:hypothetical protein